MSDFRFENHGSIFLVQPLNDEARVHLEENVQDGAMWMGTALAVEHRYALDLAEALEDNGWEVES